LNSRKIPITNGASAPPKKTSSEDTAEFRVVDRRPFAQLDTNAPVEGPVEIKPRYPTYVEELMAKVADTERRFAERVKQVDQEILRSKTRLQAESERELALAKKDMLLPFLEVLDNLERALQAASTGGTMEDLIDVLDRPFDPNVSQAVGVVPVAEPGKDGWVVKEVLPGYRMGDTLVRPAQVRVGKYQPHQRTL
jgi:molecular chaperone GrpE